MHASSGFSNRSGTLVKDGNKFCAHVPASCRRCPGTIIIPAALPQCIHRAMQINQEATKRVLLPARVSCRKFEYFHSAPPFPRRVPRHGCAGTRPKIDDSNSNLRAANLNNAPFALSGPSAIQPRVLRRGTHGQDTRPNLNSFYSIYAPQALR